MSKSILLKYIRNGIFTRPRTADYTHYLFKALARSRHIMLLTLALTFVFFFC